MPPRVRVMHDHGCWPLWVLDDGGPVRNIDPRALGLSASLAGRLRAWQSWGDSRVNVADPADSRTVGAPEEQAYDTEGRVLAERVAIELPHAAVTYWRDER